MKAFSPSNFFERLVPHDKWRRGALVFAAASIFTFVVNFSFTIWTTTKNAPNGIGIIWEGEQKTIKVWNTALHVAINIISTILLAGSNYCMQCIMAPTRSELDKAHSKKTWLDIGIPTIRNFWSITLRRKLIWILLSVSSFPLHLLFNSIVFASISTNSYFMYVVDTEDVVVGGASSFPPTLETNLLPHIPSYFPNTTLSLSDPLTCINDYGTAFQSRRGSVLLVVNFKESDGKAVQDKLSYYDSKQGGRSSPFEWICTNKGIKIASEPCDERIDEIKKDMNLWRPYRLQVESCYSEHTQEHSKLFFSSTICWTVTLLNLLKGFLMLWVAYGDIDATEPPILTFGDAVASYLQSPDDYTRKMCLSSKKAFDKQDWYPRPNIFNPKPKRKYRASSGGRWAICILLCCLTLSFCGLLLSFGLTNLQRSVSSLTKYGLGVVHSDTIMLVFREYSDPLIFCVVLANAPQVLMSLIYFNYNAIFTCISLATEWDRFYSINKKGLRVSTQRHGDQRETYFLQLPYRYSLPLACFSGFIHWLISQTIFLVRIEVYDMDNKLDEKTTSCGWSPVGFVCLIAAGVVLVVFLVASGWRRLRHGGIPVAGSCSAAIAAACHPGPSEPASAATLPLSWGVVSGKDVTPGHCSFTSREVEKPVEDCLYK